MSSLIINCCAIVVRIIHHLRFDSKSCRVWHILQRSQWIWNLVCNQAIFKFCILILLWSLHIWFTAISIDTNDETFYFIIITHFLYRPSHIVDTATNQKNEDDDENDRKKVEIINELHMSIWSPRRTHADRARMHSNRHADKIYLCVGKYMHKRTHSQAHKCFILRNNVSITAREKKTVWYFTVFRICIQSKPSLLVLVLTVYRCICMWVSEWVVYLFGTLYIHSIEMKRNEKRAATSAKIQNQIDIQTLALIAMANVHRWKGNWTVVIRSFFGI